MLYLRLFYEFAKIGLFSIGGGLVTLPFLYSLSDKTGWFTHTDVVNLIAVSESTPGPIGINAATYVGYLVGGVGGAILATAALILPSLVIVLVISRVLAQFRDSRLVNDLFYGLRPASTGLIAAAGFLVMRVTFWAPGAHSLLTLLRWPQIGLGLVLLFATRKWDRHPVFYIALSALAGIILRLSR